MTNDTNFNCNFNLTVKHYHSNAVSLLEVCFLQPSVSLGFLPLSILPHQCSYLRLKRLTDGLQAEAVVIQFDCKWTARVLFIKVIFNYRIVTVHVCTLHSVIMALRFNFLLILLLLIQKKKTIRRKCLS